MIRGVSIFSIALLFLLSACNPPDEYTLYYSEESEINPRYEASDNSIHAFNPYQDIMPKISNLRKAWKIYGERTQQDNLVLVHISDFHGFKPNMSRLSDFLTIYSEFIDDVVHTGDLFGTDISGEYPIEFEKGWLNVIGNHDATLHTDNGYVIQPSKESYNKLFAGNIEHWNVCQPLKSKKGGKCYYYKDYIKYGVRLVVLDNYVQGNSQNNHWNLEQKTWFENVLSETLDKSSISYGFHVIVAVHYPAFTMEKQPDNPFDSRDFGTKQSGKCVDDIPATVKAFKQRGGNFVCYLTGHLHSDMFGVGLVSEGYDDQLCISVACASVPAAQPYCDMARKEGDKTQDCFNLVGVDTSCYKLKMMRIGADYDRYMRKKDVLCWDYKNNEIVYVN